MFLRGEMKESETNSCIVNIDLLVVALVRRPLPIPTQSNLQCGQNQSTHQPDSTVDHACDQQTQRHGDRADESRNRFSFQSESESCLNSRTMKSSSGTEVQKSPFVVDSAAEDPLGNESNMSRTPFIRRLRSVTDPDSQVIHLCQMGELFMSGIV